MLRGWEAARLLAVVAFMNTPIATRSIPSATPTRLIIFTTITCQP
jgi:hypothetical protein